MFRLYGFAFFLTVREALPQRRKADTHHVQASPYCQGVLSHFFLVMSATRKRGADKAALLAAAWLMVSAL